MQNMQKKTLYRHHQQIYNLYHGDQERAVVENGVCVESAIIPQTGATWRSNNPDADPWRGLSVDDLKAAGFHYAFSQQVVTDEHGNAYIPDEDYMDEPDLVGWLREDGLFEPEYSEHLTHDQVNIVDLAAAAKESGK